MRSQRFLSLAPAWVAAFTLFHGCAPSVSPPSPSEEVRAPVEARTASPEPTREPLTTVEVGEGNELVVVLLHGYGAAGDDLVRLGRSLHQAVPAARFVMPAAPISMGRGRRWFGRRAEGATPDELEGAVEAVHALLVQLEEQGVDRSRLWLGGFSQGAMLTLEMARREQKLAGLFVLSGATLPTWQPTWPSELPRTRVLIAHGRQDTVLPFQGAETLRDAFEERGADVRWLPFGGGHTIPPAAIEAMTDMLRGTLN